jgi:hypothetical protein
MEVTAEQRKNLLHTLKTADHMFRWVYDTLNSDNISVKQYNVLIKIHDMLPNEQMGYVIHQDTLYPVPRKLKRYQKTANGWKQTNRYTGIIKSRKKDK